MSTIVTRAGKGSPLTHNEVDANFNNLNNDKVEESTTITAGTGLSGGGDLSANRTISLANTAVTPGSYGSASAVGTFTVDAQGRLTAASNTNISIANTAVSGLGTMSTQNANNVAITGGSVNGTTIGGSTAAAGTFTSATVSTGNLTFSSTGQRITGDFSNATVASRLAFQTSTTNGTTTVTAIPNGTQNVAAFSAESDSAATNSSTIQIAIRPTTGDAAVIAGIRGTGTYLPMTFYTGGSERMRLDTSGNLGIGTASPTFKLVAANSGTDGGWIYSTGAVSVLGLGGYANSGDGAFQIRYDRATGGITLNGGTRDTPAARVTIDNSGNVGIGTASPSYKLQVNNASASATADAITVQNSGVTTTGHAAGIRFRYVTAEPAAIRAILTDTGTGAGALGFYTSADGTGANLAERMRITSGGDLLVGCTSAPSSSVVGVRLGKSATQGYGMSAAGGTGSLEHWYYYNPNGLVGTITTSGSATAYNTSSDRRLKENIAPADDAGALVDAIQIVKHDWKVGGHTRYGAVAQDLYEVVPEAVAKGDDGEEIEKTWGVDYSKLVPILVKEIQSLRARVAALEAK